MIEERKDWNGSQGNNPGSGGNGRGLEGNNPGSGGNGRGLEGNNPGSGGRVVNEKERPYKEEFRRHGNRRKRGHDYKAPSIYHITINKMKGCEDFSVIKRIEGDEAGSRNGARAGEGRAAGSRNGAHVGEGRAAGNREGLTVDGVRAHNLELGDIIVKAMRIMVERMPQIQLYQYCIMPDHVHLLLRVKARLPKAVGIYIGGLKTGVANEWRRQKDNQELDVFEAGYNDRIIYPSRDLDVVFRYIRQNPYRLFIRREHPEFFRKRRNVEFAGCAVQIYGNAFLLRNPFCYSLIIHRADTEADYERKLEDCRYYAANGGVVVSAFISPREKAIRAMIEEEGGRIIQIHHSPFGEREKPELHNFELCCEGRLLLVAPLKYMEYPKLDKPTRSQCLEMNALGEKFCGGKD